MTRNRLSRLMNGSPKSTGSTVPKNAAANGALAADVRRSRQRATHVTGITHLVWPTWAVALLLLAIAFAPPLRAQRSPAERAKALDNRIMCMCGGCSEAAGKCNHMGGSFSGPCETAQKEMKEVSARIAMGQSDDLILQSFVQEYGPTVLLSPPARGFDLWAWLMPIIFSLTGIALAGFVVMRWRHRTTVAPAPRIAPELLARARHDMHGEFDD